MAGTQDLMRIARRPLLLFLAALLWAVASGAFARALEIRKIVLTVADLDRSVAFYHAALGFTKVSERLVADRDHDYAIGVFGARVRSATLQLGSETIELAQYLSPAGRPIPPDSRANDLWFQHFAVVVSDMDKAYAQLTRVPFQAISSAPQTIPQTNAAAAGIRAFKFKDPDGHPLELLYFPPGKGDPKWQRATDKLFLGIDHSAITVSDTQRSLIFYRDVLGLHVVGKGLNTGSTQEHLDGAFGAVVRITGLRPEGAQGPGLEFLQYLTPAGGRPAPVDAHPNDLAHVHVVLAVDDIEHVVDQLTRSNAAFISPGVVAADALGFGKSALVKDPDGHAVMLVQRSGNVQ
jgi:catechol 2,3-dioxygenase-like lactoylglutathione lyase family enzyme